MAIVHYTARVKESRLLELPEEAQELGLKPGEIAELQKDMPYSSGENSITLLHEARAGAMYGCDLTE
jgi:hypothetical protein